VVGQRFGEMLRPFGCVLRVYDPFAAQVPEYVERVFTLRELFEKSEIIVIHAGLTETTRGSITAELLALLPDQGVLVNTARGDIVDQEALFAELRSGRLRAGLDVLAVPERLATEHPARRWENLILTCHAISRGWPRGNRTAGLRSLHQVCLDNLRRFRDGRDLRFVIDRQRYALIT